jgi:enoyl-CoA hydratase/carnithine racemase
VRRSYGGHTLSWEVDAGGVLDVVLHRDPCNEIGLATLSELEGLAERIGDADDIGAMVLRSVTPRGFCAGADLRELHAGLAESRRRLALGRDALFDGVGTAARAAWSTLRSLEPGVGLEGAARRWGVRAFLDRIHRVFGVIDAAPFPTVAAVHGVCFGGGFELALCADVIVADKSARFAFPELRLGLIPGFGGIPRLERDLGNAVLRDLLLSGRSLGAKRAHEVGLAGQLVGRGQAPRVAARLAEQLLRFDGATARAAKRFLKPYPSARLEAEKDLFCRLLTSPAVEAALARFVTSSDAMPYLP